MALSNTVCRDIINTQAVIKTQLVNLLITELITSGKVSKDDVVELTTKMSKCVDDQTNSLVDRMLHEFTTSESK